MSSINVEKIQHFCLFFWTVQETNRGHLAREYMGRPALSEVAWDAHATSLLEFLRNVIYACS